MVKPGIMNHDFADVRAIMSETGKVHLGTGVAEGEDRITQLLIEQYPTLFLKIIQYLVQKVF